MRHKYIPNIECIMNPENGGYTFKCKDMEHFVSKEEMQNCWKDLQIINSDNFYARFKEVCDWFIAQTQYVEFQEVN